MSHPSCSLKFTITAEAAGQADACESPAAGASQAKVD
jgi:hypothetical protein